jgi:hypothetical protein
MVTADDVQVVGGERHGELGRDDRMAVATICPARSTPASSAVG